MGAWVLKHQHEHPQEKLAPTDHKHNYFQNLPNYYV